jgi:hypothetical protein
MRFRNAAWLLPCVALVVLGCGKGDTGPMGPAGARGAIGPEGPAGSSDVIYSAWYSPTTWAAETQFGIALRTYTMSATSLTQTIVDQGVVLVYLRFVGLNPAIIQLPFVTADASALSFYFQAAAGSVKVLYYSPATPTVSPSVIPSSNQVRYVLIPGAAPGAAPLANGSTRAQEIARLKSMSYSEVCRKYGIPE